MRRNSVEAVEILAELEEKVKAAGLTLQLRDQNTGHYQITGGKVLLNYYPLSMNRTAYIQGTKNGVKHVDADKAVRMALQKVDPKHLMTRNPHGRSAAHRRAEPTIVKEHMENLKTKENTPPWQE